MYKHTCNSGKEYGLALGFSTMLTVSGKVIQAIGDVDGSEELSLRSSNAQVVIAVGQMIGIVLREVEGKRLSEQQALDFAAEDLTVEDGMELALIIGKNIQSFKQGNSSQGESEPSTKDGKEKAIVEVSPSPS